MHQHDHDRLARIGLPEAVLCEPKSHEQIAAIVRDLLGTAEHPVLFTRLGQAQFGALPSMAQDALDYDVESRTARLGGRLPKRPGSIAVIAAGTSDVPVAREAVRTLEFSGVEFAEFFDVGVAGLWRIEACIDEIRTHDAVIVAAGMDAALVSVLGGLLAAPIIAVPTSVGYGVATGGHTALNASLASCAQGVTVVNIDNGFGAACAAVRMLSLLSPSATS